MALRIFDTGDSQSISTPIKITHNKYFERFLINRRERERERERGRERKNAYKTDEID